MKTVYSNVALIIPAQNEEAALPGVLTKLPALINRIIVVDNGSTDRTAEVAARHGAQVVYEPVAGYGRACLAGLAALQTNPPDIVAFVDADGSDELSCLSDLIAPVSKGEADLALGTEWLLPLDRVDSGRDGSAYLSAAFRASSSNFSDTPFLETQIP